MDKLYWIACDDQDTTLFEGRYQGRTRGGALKFLKETIGRKTLNGLVFTITEIPVPLIREIVAELLAGGDGTQVLGSANIVPLARPQPEPAPGRYDAFNDVVEPEADPEPEPTPAKPTKKVGNPGHGDEHWARVRAHWEECRSVKRTAEHFSISPNSLKTRMRREGWNR